MNVHVLGAPACVQGWFGSRSYHHTGMVSMWYAMREALAVLSEEGLEASWARHEAAHQQVGLPRRGASQAGAASVQQAAGSRCGRWSILPARPETLAPPAPHVAPPCSCGRG